MNVQENLDRFKKTQTETLKVAMSTADRVDNWMEIRSAFKMYFEETPDRNDVDDFINIAINMYNAMIERCEELTVEDVDVPMEDFKDPFDGLVAPTSECETEKEIFIEFLKFNLMRGYAQQVINFNRMINEEKQATVGESED